LKNNNLLIYLAGAGKILSIIIVLYQWAIHSTSVVGILKRTRIHLSFQLIISVLVVLALVRLYSIWKSTSNMRKQAGEQKLALSKRGESLLFMLIVNVLFNSLFLTYSPRRYLLSGIETPLYIVNLILQFILIAYLVNSREGNHKAVVKLDHRYSIVGAITGLLAYITYFQMMT